MAKALSVKNLNKYYGDFQAVKNISFDIEEKEIFGLVGPNGAGKSTTLKTVATVFSFNEGEITVYGHDLKEKGGGVRQLISYLPEEAGAYKNLTGRQYLDFMASLYAKDKRERGEFVDIGVELSGLGDSLKNKVKSYSKGMTRKLLLARTIMTKPRLAILDEPTSGLDVINSIEIRQTIKSMAKSGMAVLLSSHNMLEIDFLSDRVAIINKGEIRAEGTPAALKERFGARNLEEVFIALGSKKTSYE